MAERLILRGQALESWSAIAVAAVETVMRLGLEAVHRARLNGLARRLLPCQGVIFALHRVKPAAKRGFAPNQLLEVTPEFLDETIQTVRSQGFDIVDLDNALDRVLYRQQRPFACFTFDDAYRDNKDYAAPILQKYGVPYTIYVPEHFADGTGQLWWVELELAVEASAALSAPDLFDGELLACGTVQEKTRTYRRIYWHLRSIDEAAARELVKRLCLSAGVDASRVCRELILPWDDLRDLAKNPLVSIGAHTVRHFAVARLTATHALQEMTASKVRIEEEIDRECRHFSYPYGDAASVSARDVDLARHAGFASAVTMRKGLVGAGLGQDVMALPRCSLNGNFQDQRYVAALMSGLPFFLWGGFAEWASAFAPYRQAASSSLAGAGRRP